MDGLWLLRMVAARHGPARPSRVQAKVLSGSGLTHHELMVQMCKRWLGGWNFVFTASHPVRPSRPSSPSCLLCAPGPLVAPGSSDRAGRALDQAASIPFLCPAAQASRQAGKPGLLVGSGATVGTTGDPEHVRCRCSSAGPSACGQELRRRVSRIAEHHKVWAPPRGGSPARIK